MIRRLRAERQGPSLLRVPGRLDKADRPLALLLIIGLVATFLAVLYPVPNEVGAVQETQTALQEDIVAGLRGGESYYPAAVRRLRDADQPVQPFIAVRLPTLAVMQAGVPALLLPWLLYSLGILVAMTWAGRLAGLLSAPIGVVAGLVGLAVSLLAFLRPELIWIHDAWAALLVALSLALRRRRLWLTAAAVAVVAVAIRETAGLYALVMGVIAWIEGERREAAGWLAVVLVLAVLLGAHAWALMQVTGPMDLATPGWPGTRAIAAAVRAVAAPTVLQLLPAGFGAVLVVLALAGWLAPRDGLALRTGTMHLAYILLLILGVEGNTTAIALMLAPTLLIGLALLPDLLRGLVVPLLDRRRVQVQRIVR